ncbi:COG4223 family protein [Litoreibacter janthinus]|uniref:Uncharacterized conserved protein n=1 Tax=Litoreibacter janthinus TaxID=670154 RepID=A0A1I6FVT7_9RHOB|nr:hypothetical protein [Litoreibacter janthinus]SFR34065.1 Uncharacterized conserved protein [Litoreibacter janthinus]
MARKKNTPSKTDATPEKSDVSKAGAISGVVQGAEFDELDAAMVDTKAEGVALGDGEVPDSSSEIPEDAELVDEAADAISDDDVEAPEEDAEAPEPEAEKSPEPQVETVNAPVTVVEKRGGFFAPLLGGALAALIGFGGAIYFKAAEWPVFGGGNDFESLIAEQSKTIASMQAALDAAQAGDAEARAALAARIDELPTTQSVQPLPADVQAKLEAQRAEMETLEASLEKMRLLTQDQIANAQAQQESAAQAEARAKARGALNALRTALTTGAPYSPVVPEIAAATDVPEVLAANADSGVPTAAALEAQFSDGARAALSASLKATAGDSATDRLTFFLKDQLGARSLTPRDGDDPDAVLSRAEAAAKAGDIDAALTLIDGLPDLGKAELQDWASAAETRRDALAAFDSLSDALNAN